MDEVEDAVRCEGGNYEPQRGLKANESDANEGGCYSRLNDENLARAAHDCEQRVVRCDHNHHHRIQRSIPV